jgi:hypothetical protein
MLTGWGETANFEDYFTPTPIPGKSLCGTKS